MADRYSQYLVFAPENESDIWEIAKHASQAVMKFDFKPQHEWLAARLWSISSDSRSWDRPSLSEARKAAHVAEGSTFSVHWSFYGESLQWALTAQTFDNGRRSLTLQAYAGRDRLRTEEVVRDVAEALTKRGLSVEVTETQVSSSDDGGQAEVEPLSPRTKPRGSLTAVGESVKEHVGAYVVGVLVLITGGILAALGFKVI